MIWQNLYTGNRLGDPKTKKKSGEGRSSFLKDYDRILFSAPFRKLQNKTQVFPLPEDIFVHNRLTHSLEVAAVGRSLGSVVGERLCEINGSAFDQQTKHFYMDELAHVISAACLSHDIGNPPFGHAGEVAISQFFIHLKEQNIPSLSSLTEHQWNDLCYFEGNANGFRILVQNRGSQNDAFRLTLTTLASMIKYPVSSVEGNQKKSPFISNKKYGFFTSEQDAFNEIVNCFDLPLIDERKKIYARHPFVYLVEAADDICYLIIDLEDAHSLGLVDFEECTELLSPFFEDTDGFWSYKNIKDRLKKIEGRTNKMSYLRAITINLLVSKCSDVFIDNESKLLSGELHLPLMNGLNEKDLDTFQKLKEFSYRKIYSHPQVAEKELTGFHVMENILQEFTGIITQPNHPKGNLIKKILSESVCFWEEKISAYENLRILLDYVTSLSDFQAVKLSNKLRGF